MTSRPPDLREEKRLLRAGFSLVCAVDEVGRGALSGPVSVGMVLVDSSVRRPLGGVRDSKLLTPEARAELVPRIRRWAVGYAVGHAEAWEIDALGLTRALRLAGLRAYALLPQSPDVVLLDGSHNWLGTPAQAVLFEDSPGEGDSAEAALQCDLPPVVTKVKADLTCAAVAAASVLAKTTRDATMVCLAAEYPGYGWEVNKGYAAPAHRDALRVLGPSAQHRQTWHLIDDE